MLLRPGQIPTGDNWAFEHKWDGFRALVSTENGLEVRSRRAWNMTDHVPELATIPRGLVLDGELVAFNDQRAPAVSSLLACTTTAFVCGDSSSARKHNPACGLHERVAGDVPEGRAQDPSG